MKARYSVTILRLYFRHRASVNRANKVRRRSNDECDGGSAWFVVFSFCLGLQLSNLFPRKQRFAQQLLQRKVLCRPA